MDITKAWIIQPGQRDLSCPERPPSLQIMTEVPVECQVIFKEHYVICACAQTPLKSAQGGIRLALATIIALFGIHLDVHRGSVPIRPSEIFERLAKQVSSF